MKSLLSSKKRLLGACGGFLILVVVLVGLAFYSPNKQVVANQPVLTPQYTESFTLTGESMEPTIMPGQKFIVTHGISPKVNDIISIHCPLKCLYPNQNQAADVVKRVISIDINNCYFLQGDNKANSHDSWDFGTVCPSERDYVAVVTQIIPNPSLQTN